MEKESANDFISYADMQNVPTIANFQGFGELFN